MCTEVNLKPTQNTLFESSHPLEHKLRTGPYSMADSFPSKTKIRVKEHAHRCLLLNNRFYQEKKQKSQMVVPYVVDKLNTVVHTAQYNTVSSTHKETKQPFHKCMAPHLRTTSSGLS